MLTGRSEVAKRVAMPRTGRASVGGLIYHALNRGNRRANEPLSAGDLARLRESVTRERPFGAADWTRQTAAQLGLGFTLRGRGRPKRE